MSEDFILYHTEPIESSGFCIHFKLPHYVTFASGTDSVRKMISVLYGTHAAGEDAETDRAAVREESLTAEAANKGSM